MRKTTILLSMLVLTAMVLAACGGGATSTNVVESPPPITMEVTETMEATEVPTEAATGEPGVPVTGDVNPARVSNQLDFTVWTQDGQQVGEVDDMVLDLDNPSVAYVIVSANANMVAVPWESLELRSGTATGTGTGEATAVPTTDGSGTDQSTATPGTGTGGTDTGTATTEPAATEPAATGDAGTGTGIGTSGQENVFILLTDLDTFNNAPAFDPSSLPGMGQPAGDWDAEINSYWQSGGATGGTGSTGTDTAGTPSPDGTVVPEGTATDMGSTGTGQSTATADAGTAGTGTGTGAQAAAALQGVVLASEVLGSTVNLGVDTGVVGPGTGEATVAPTTDGSGTGTGQSTATPGTGSTGTGSDTTGTGTTQGAVSGTIEDLIVDTDSGDVMYIVVNASFDDGERWIPVPLGLFQWDGSSFSLNADGTMLQDAPFFQDGQFPDTTMGGWNSEFDSFWQNSGAGGGSGSGSDATATP